MTRISEVGMVVELRRGVTTARGWRAEAAHLDRVAAAVKPHSRTVHGMLHVCAEIMRGSAPVWEVEAAETRAPKARRR